MGAIKELLKAGIKALVKDEGQATAKVAKSGKEELAIAKDSGSRMTSAKIGPELEELITKRDRLKAKLRSTKGKSTDYSTGLYSELDALETKILDAKASLSKAKTKSAVLDYKSKSGVGTDVLDTNTNTTGKPMATKLGVDEYMGKLKKNHERSEGANKERYEEMMKSGLGK